MHCNRIGRGLLTCAVFFLGAVLPIRAGAGTIVRIDTNLGQIDVELFDDAAPLTVDNFINYAATGRFQNTIFHRAISNFIVQGGAFTSDYAVRPTDLPVKNEFNHTNIRGTIAMAKQPDNPDSATNQWFINLADNNDPNNPLSLDNQNGGFTVFGRVISGMSIADVIAQPGDGVPPDFIRGNFSNSRFGIPPQVDVSGLPVRNYSQADFDASVRPNTNHLAIINNVTVIGSSTSAFQNPDNRFDPDDNSTIVPQDILRLVDDFNRNGERALPDNFVGPLFVDIDGNKRFNSADIDSLVDFVNENGFTISGFLSHAAESEFTAGGLLSASMSSGFLATPEPSSAMLSMLGLAALGCMRRRILAAANAGGFRRLS